MTKTRSFVFGVGLVILLGIIATGIRVYHRLQAPVPKQDTIFVGTHQDPDMFYITNPGTRFKVSDHLIVDVEYKPEPSEDLPLSSETRCLVVDTETGKTVQEQDWVDSNITTGRDFSLNNTSWHPGAYKIELYRFGKLDASVTITLH